jgi:hypothetical protein
MFYYTSTKQKQIRIRCRHLLNGTHHFVVCRRIIALIFYDLTLPYLHIVRSGNAENKEMVKQSSCISLEAAYNSAMESSFGILGCSLTARI